MSANIVLLYKMAEKSFRLIPFTLTARSSDIDHLY